jgi:cell wall-associated NlpC family hydrolase
LRLLPTDERRWLSRRRAIAVLAFATLVLLGAVVLVQGDDGAGREDRGKAEPVVTTTANGIRDTEAAQAFPEPGASDHQLAESPTEVATNAAATDDAPSPGAPSDAQVRRELRQLERYQRRARQVRSIDTGPGGLARAPDGAPSPIADVIAGGNAIATFPYRLGGGHGSFTDNAYDCSGSVSYALAAAGMVDAPLTSSELMSWGAPGRGRWLTVYANPGHVYMAVGNLRFDTSGRAGRRGSRWQTAQRLPGGFEARHWPGL